MAAGGRDVLVREFMGSVQIFLVAVSGVIEERLLHNGSAKPLTLSQLRVLALLAHTEARTVGEVAALLRISDAAASKAVDKMVRRKLVRRREAASDRRASELALTEAGARLVRTYENSRNRELARVFEEIPRQDVRRAALLLDRLTSRIVNQTGRPEGICLQCGIHLQKRCLVREAARSDCAWSARKNRSKARKHDSNEQGPRTPDAVPAGGRPGVGAHGS